MKYLYLHFLFSLIFLLLLGLLVRGETRALPSQPQTIAIVVYDAGETFGLLPIVPFLKAENVLVQWIPLTPWTLRILEEENESFLQPPEDLNRMAHVDDRKNDSEITHWLNFITDAKPSLVVLGLVSRIQEHLAQELSNRGFLTIGFYDAFDETDGSSIIWQVANRVNEVWVPTKNIKRNLNELGLKSVKVTGQPSLESWYLLAKEIKTDSLRNQLRISSDKKIIVFAGQYGEGYKEILDAFASVAFEELNRRDDLYLVFSPHPKTSGELESTVVQKNNHSRMLVVPPGITTAKLAAICNVMVTWRSTVGVQTAFMGKPVIYFNFDLNDYRNDLIDQGIAQTTTPKTFGSALQFSLAHEKNQTVKRDRLAKLGYVVNSDQKLSIEIVKRIRK